MFNPWENFHYTPPDSAMFYSLYFLIKKEMYGPSSRFQEIKLQTMSWRIKYIFFSSTEKLRTLKLSKVKGKMRAHS